MVHREVLHTQRDNRKQSQIKYNLPPVNHLLETATLELGTISCPILVHSSARDHIVALAYHQLTSCHYKHIVITEILSG